MVRKISAKRLLLGETWQENQVVTIADGYVSEIRPGNRGDVACETLTAGLFDTHSHGGEGYYTIWADEKSLNHFLQELARHGVTDILLTIGAVADYTPLLALFRSTMQKQFAGALGGTRIQGVHLEGPFVNPQKAGAMDAANMRLPSPETFTQLFAEFMEIIRLVTIAPEQEGARQLIHWLRQNGVCAQLGHTLANCAEAQAAFAWGANSLCHTFNACPPLLHRQPGAVAAALIDDSVYCEAICDCKHVHPLVLRMIYRLKGPQRMVVISDSGAATGLPDGEYCFAGRKYRVVDGVNRAQDGITLAGGSCYLDLAVRHLIALGIPSEHALRMASQTPADALGLQKLGGIHPGGPAHLAAWTSTWRCAFSVIGDALYDGANE